MKSAILALFVLGFAFCVDAVAATPNRTKIDPRASGDTVAEEVCASCHGADGMSPLSNVPNLAGQPVEYLTKQLQEFRGQTRSDPRAIENMWSIAHKLTDKQIAELARHFSALRPRPQPIEGKPERIAAGKTIFTGGALAQGVPPCAGCHGTDGAGKTMFPRLAGQHTDYVVKQLMVFQTTNQRPRAGVMKAVSHELTPESMLDVASYLQALPHETAP